MTELKLIEAARNGNLSEAEEMIKSGADVNQQGEQGWTPLNFAAGRGDLEFVRLLVNSGADIEKVGRDQRTPYLIALSAGHVDVAKFLKALEDEKRGDPNEPEREFCKGYRLAEFRKFPAWSESRINWKAKDAGDEEFNDDTIGYLHQDFTVTRAIGPGEDVIFNAVTPEWKEFCITVLHFKVPTMLDLAVSNEEEPER